MFHNYIKIAIRNLLRQKAFSFINILGLAIGMASAMIILLWVQHTVSYDDFHKNKDRIYEVWNRVNMEGELRAWNYTPTVLSPTINSEAPEVEHATRFGWPYERLFAVGEKRLFAKGHIVDSNFLQIFTFPLLEGDIKTALNGPHSAVITKSFADKLFKNGQALGQTFLLDDKDYFTVTGVLKDIPANSQFDFEYLLPYSYEISKGNDYSYWGNLSLRTYVLLKPNASLASANNKLKDMRSRHDNSIPGWEMFLYPMNRWHLYSNFTNGVENGNGLISIVRMFTAVALVILLVACINFMNLSTARSERRFKEVGIRKVVGAKKSSLVGQFIGESILISLIAGVLAIIITILLLPAFNQLFNERISFDITNPVTILRMLGFILATGLLAGSYPSFFLSSFKPVKVLKGTFEKPRTLVTPRKVLVILQFAFATILIIGATIIRQQISFAFEREVGYKNVDLVYHSFTGDISKNFELIRRELLSSGAATAVIKTNSPITQVWSIGWGQEWQGKDPNDRTNFVRFSEDGGLAEAIGFQFIAGRDIDPKKFPTDSTAMIINESALKVMKFKDPIGQIVKDNGVEWRIVGVIRDFIIDSPFQPAKPMLISGPANSALFSALHMKMNPGRSMLANLEQAEKIFKKYNPNFPFTYKFVDEDYGHKFDQVKRFGTLVNIFTAFTIFISCLGLFGLAAYMAESRIKEIGVRKVLGSSVIGITALLSKDFLKLVIMSFVLAFPVAWWAMDRWLQGFSYRITLQWWVFVVAGLIVVLIAFITVSSLAIKAAIVDPAKSLRAE